MPKKKRTKGPAKKPEGPKRGRGRPPKEPSAAERAEYLAIDRTTAAGRAKAADFVERLYLDGKLSDKKHEGLMKGLRQRGLMAVEASAVESEDLMREFLRARKEGRKKGSHAIRDTGPPPDDLSEAKKGRMPH